MFGTKTFYGSPECRSDELFASYVREIVKSTNNNLFDLKYGLFDKKTLLLLLAMVPLTCAYSTPLSERDKRIFLEKEIPSCLQKQRSYAQQLNIKFDELIIYSYCKCYLMKISDRASMEEILEVSKSKSTVGLKNILDKAYEECNQSVVIK